MVVYLILFSHLIAAAPGCTTKTPTLLQAPNILTAYEVHAQTRYSLTTYAQDEQQLIVLRDQDGKTIASLLYSVTGIYILLPGENPHRISRTHAPMARDELTDVWNGSQALFSFVPLLK